MNRRVPAPIFAIAALVGVLGATAAPSGYALEVARMKLPEEFAAAADRWRASGFGGKNKGEYALGGYHGAFTRTESRFAVFDPLFAKRRGTSSFTLQGPNVDGIVSATCEFAQKSVTVGVVTFDPARLVYTCDLSHDSRGSLGNVVLGEPPPADTTSRLLAMSVRRGEARVGSDVIGIASVHEYATSKLRAPMPVGYLFSRDEEVVGALELTDSQPTVLLRRDLDAQIRSATLYAALSVAVLRDPAHSALGGPDD